MTYWKITTFTQTFMLKFCSSRSLRHHPSSWMTGEWRTLTTSSAKRTTAPSPTTRPSANMSGNEIVLVNACRMNCILSFLFLTPTHLLFNFFCSLRYFVSFLPMISPTVSLFYIFNFFCPHYSPSTPISPSDHSSRPRTPRSPCPR